MQRSFRQHNHPPRDLSHFPKYAQRYPSLARYHLCDVKRSVSYPNPPTFRNIDRDDVLHKLSDEHCRHTTLCGPECFDERLDDHDGKNFVKRDFCIDKLLAKYSLDPKDLRNENFEILKVCPSERRHFRQMVCGQHKDVSFCIEYDPTLVMKEEEVSSTNCYLCAPWN